MLKHEPDGTTDTSALRQTIHPACDRATHQAPVRLSDLHHPEAVSKLLTLVELLLFLGAGVLQDPILQSENPIVCVLGLAQAFDVQRIFVGCVACEVWHCVRQADSDI